MKLMSASPLREVRSLWWPVLTGVCYYLAAAVALAVSHGRDGIATVWPSSGILLAALLINENRQRGWHLATAAAASMVVNLNLGNGAWISTGFTIANIMESSLAAWLGSRLVQSQKAMAAARVTADRKFRASLS